MQAGAFSVLLAVVLGLFAVVPAPNVREGETASLIRHSQTAIDEQQRLQPFLTLPFRTEDAPQVRINEGWYYSPEEELISNKSLHRGVDFPMPRGTPVVAAADGLALRSFQVAMTDETYQGKTIGFSLGEFVEIYHPEQKVYTLYAHLEKASDETALATTEQLSVDTWEPAGIYVDAEARAKMATPVKRGQIIGFVGDSGIGWGYSDSFNLSTGHVTPRNTAALPSWDEPHLHFEVYTRTPDGRLKQTRFDPFALYDQVRPERNPYWPATPQPGNLWLLNENGKPKYSQ